MKGGVTFGLLIDQGLCEAADLDLGTPNLQTHEIWRYPHLKDESDFSGSNMTVNILTMSFILNIHTRPENFLSSDYPT